MGLEQGLVQRQACVAPSIPCVGLRPVGVQATSNLGRRGQPLTHKPRQGAGLRARAKPKRAQAAYTPFHWNAGDFYRASPQLLEGNPYQGAGAPSGYLLMMREGPDGKLEDVERGLIVSIGGDTLAGIAMLLSNTQGERPLSLDLLYRVLERGQELSRREWRVLRVAIVELRGNTYIGRLFFGDPTTGAVAWDTDCRPSDGCWLALKSRCPFFIAKKVWDNHASSLKELARSESDPAADARRQQAEQRRAGGAAAGAGMAAGVGLAWEAAAAGDPDSAFALMTTLRQGDPEPLTLLKMELRVALRGEDYEAAARIRDHPYMRLHVEAVRALRAGDSARAAELEEKLHDWISATEASGSVSEGD